MDDGADHASAAVLANRALFTHIAGFVRGYPYAVLRLSRDTFKQFSFGRAVEKRIATTLPQLAVVAGDAETLRLLQKLKTQPHHRDDPLLSTAGIDRVAILLQRKKMLECIAELAARDPEWEWEPTLMDFAVDYARGDLRVLDWVFQYLPQHLRVVMTQTSEELVRIGDADAVRWLVEHGFEISAQAACIAADKGRADVLAYLYEHTDQRCSLRSIRQAVINAANMEITKIITGIGVSSKYAINAAAERGRLDVVTYLHAHIPGGCTPQAMNRAAAFGHIDVVKFLHAHRTEGCTTSAMDSAAALGGIAMVKFLHTHRTEGCTSAAMRNAAYGGHLEVIRFLHTHRTEGCTTGAMDSAAAQGHLEVVNAMDRAAQKGYVEIVAFLHKYRREGCTTRAMDDAVANGHLSVVKFLHRHRSEGFTSAAIDHAAVFGHHDVVVFLRKNQSKGRGLVRQVVQWRPRFMRS
ncbi:hypothetical protein PybrP1_009366 [[Pythium] brassicae (nom. inval.)]|nr:hypothetical protein PybrP1_009366 [[Pythium] brassicae (nom. inval.)]